MKVTALGVNSAFSVGNVVTGGGGEKLYQPAFQSNFLLQFKTKGKIRDDVYNLVIDFGSDIRHSLAFSGYTVNDIDGWYCSHPHADHIGGVEGIALSTFFNPFYTGYKTQELNEESVTSYTFAGGKLGENAKPDLLGNREVIKELWHASAPGLKTLQGVMRPDLETYFNLKLMQTNFTYKIEDGDHVWTYYTIESTHVVSGTSHMPSYGLMFERDDGFSVYFPTDTLFMMPPTMESFYRKANYIYQDCETGFKSGVHSHIDEIRACEDSIKSKCYLYHYQEEPAAREGEFAGILRTGEVHEW